MKQDTEWTNVSTSYDPLTLYRLIERTVLAQTEDQYPFATVYDQELSFYSFRQETLSNPQWYERFNTFADLGAAEQRVVRDDAEERYVSYAFLRQIGNQNGNLKMDLQNDFTTGDNGYPKNCQKTLHLLDKYSKTSFAKVNQSEGISFAQRSGGGGGHGGRSGNGKSHDNFDKEYWNTGRTRLVTIVRRRSNLQTSALINQTMTMMKKLWRGPLAVSRSSRRISSL
jgi:hypothetical protein